MTPSLLFRLRVPVLCVFWCLGHAQLLLHQTQADPVELRALCSSLNEHLQGVSRNVTVYTRRPVASALGREVRTPAGLDGKDCTKCCIALHPQKATRRHDMQDGMPSLRLHCCCPIHT